MSKSSRFSYKQGWWYISKLYKNFLEIVWFHCDQVPQVIEDNANVAAEGDAGGISQEENINSSDSDTVILIQQMKMKTLI